MHELGGAAENPDVVHEPIGPDVGPEVRRVLRKVRAFAASGRWRKVVITLSECDPDGKNPLLLSERLRAAIELDDANQVAICRDAAKRLDSYEQRINIATFMANSNRLKDSWDILAFLPSDAPVDKIVRLAKRIDRSTLDAELKGEIRAYLGAGHPVARRERKVITQRFPSDDAYVSPLPATLDITSLPGVHPDIEARIRLLWSGFDDRVKKQPFPFIREYADVFTNEHGQIWTVDGQLVHAAGKPMPEATDPDSVPVLQEAFSCVRENKGYYEWLVEHLGALSWRFSPETPDCPILMRREQRGLAAGSLLPLGIAEDQMIVVEGPLFCRKLYVGSSSAAALPRASAYQHTYGRLTELAQAQDRGDAPKRFYISRRDSSRRSMANEAEFEAGMAERGFAPVVLSELGLLEKINLFRNAEAVIGAHGAGLSHLIFARPGLRVVEIMPVTMNQFSHMGARVCFSLLSRLFSLDHLIVLHPMNPATSEWSSDPVIIADLV